RAEKRLEVRWITQLEIETETGHSVGSGVTARRQDVDVVIGQHSADVAQEFRSVEGLDLDRRHEHADAVAVPLDLDEPVSIGGDERGSVGTVGSVHRDAAPTGDETDDLVAGNRRAAP